MYFLYIIELLIGVEGGSLDNATQLLLLDRNASVFFIGIAGAITYILAMLLTLLIQKNIIHSGYKPYWLSLSAINCVALLGILLTESGFITLLFSTIASIMGWCFWALLQSYVSDATTEPNQFGKLKLLIVYGNFIGATLFYILVKLGVPNSYEIVVSVCIVDYLLVFSYFLCKRNIRPKRYITEHKGYIGLLKEKLISTYLTYYTVHNIQYALLSCLTAIIIVDGLGLSPEYVGILSIAKYMTGSLIGRIILKVKNPKQISIIASIILTLVYITVFSNNNWFALFLLLANSCYSLILELTLINTVHNLYQDGRSAMLVGLQTVAEYVTVALSMITSGYLLMLDVTYIWVISGCLMLVTLMLVIRTWRQIARQRDVT